MNKRIGIVMTGALLFAAGCSAPSGTSLSDNLQITQQKQAPVIQSHPQKHYQVDMDRTAKNRLVKVQLASDTVYHVRRGDSLSKIAKKYSLPWKGLYCANKKIVGKNPSMIRPGESLRIAKTHCKIPVLKIAQPVARNPVVQQPNSPQQPSRPVPSGQYNCNSLEQLWESAGGPSGAAVNMASIAIAESGGNPNAYNPSGASGLWQILGQVVPGNVFDPFVNALNAVKKFLDGGYAPWTTWPGAAGIC